MDGDASRLRDCAFAAPRRACTTAAATRAERCTTRGDRAGSGRPRCDSRCRRTGIHA